MKLDIKKLVGYLPYKLEAEMLDYKKDYVGKQYDTIVGFHQWDSRDLYWSVLTIGGSKPECNSIKPLLNPLSSFSSFPEIAYELTNLEYAMITENPDLILRVNYEAIQMMYKNHIDIHGLINKGLAIDKNSII